MTTDDINTIDQLFRGSKDLSRAVHADLIGRRKRLYDALYPKAVSHGGPRRGWTFKKKRIPSFVEDTATTLGVSESTVRRLLQLSEAMENRQHD